MVVTYPFSKLTYLLGSIRHACLKTPFRAKADQISSREARKGKINILEPQPAHLFFHTLHYPNIRRKTQL